MTTQAKQTKQEAKPAIVLFGLGEGEKPRAAYFDEVQAEAALKLADSMNLKVLKVVNDDQAAVAAELPPGKLYMSGKGFVPFIRQELYSKVAAMAAEGTNGPASQGDQTDPAKAGMPTAVGEQGATADRSAASGNEPAQSKDSGVGSNTTPRQQPMTGFPSSWHSIEVGHLVIAQESVDEGWWEAIVIEKDQELFSLRWRDFPKAPKFVRHRSSLALVCPIVR